MNKTESRISIGNLRYSPFNRLLLEEVYATDLNNDTLFYAEKINAGFDFIKFLRKQFLIHSIEINNFDLSISKDSINAPFNFQFLIDAFVSDKSQPDEKSNLQLAINRIKLNNGHLRYDVFSKPFQNPDILDFNHVDIRNFQLNTKLYFNNPENWNCGIKNLSFD